MNALPEPTPVGRPVQSDPVLVEFYDNTRSLRQAEIDFLVKRHAVPVLALCEDGDEGGVALSAARVIFYKAERFDFADEGDEEAVSAIVAVLRDRDDYAHDLAAWAPRSDTLGTRFGRAILIGEHELDRARLGDALRVHPTFLDWLKDGRNGIVIADGSRAWQLLYGEKLEAADVAHGLMLRKLLQSPKPEIVVPETVTREAA